MSGRNKTPNSHGKESLRTKQKPLFMSKNLSLKTKKNFAKSTYGVFCCMAVKLGH